MNPNKLYPSPFKVIKWFRNVVLLLTVLILSVGCDSNNINTVSLEGEWQVKLDSTDIGGAENWAKTPFQGKQITLPGTLDDAEIGKPNTLKPELNNYVLSNLTRKHQYIGKAWYQKEIEIPRDWKEKEITLTLERVIWESTMYVNGKEIGKRQSLVGNHEYNLTPVLSPGKHLLTICIDNSNKFPFINVAGNKYPDPINQDMAHAYTNHTQIKWNGIIGDILLEASEPGAPDNLQVYTDSKNNTIKIAYDTSSKTIQERLFEIVDTNKNAIYSKRIRPKNVEKGIANYEFERPSTIESWDEFNPNLYEARLISGADTLKTIFGYRTVSKNNGTLTLNGKRIFLRGNLECSIFPLTGHPPMQKKEWAKLIAQAKAYGLNHLRFHSWCPPKAAFQAADEAGFYLQVELPHWSLKVGEDAKTNQFLMTEAHKILDDYGNHPSFILMALGNELQGDIGLLNKMTAKLKDKDDRRLFTTTAFSFQKPTGTRPEAEDEFFVAQWTDKGWIRGQGIFNDKPPHFDADYSKNSSHINIPLVSHEIGQYAVYPDMSEIPKYTGVLQPINFIAIKNDLVKKGLIDLADEFTIASGKLAAMLYKEEIERALKTSDFDGFQLLQLQDFPGQGTALVGLLNAFWESKGAISAEEFRKFNSEVVPLIRFKKATYENGENFEGTLEVANFYKEFKDQQLNFQIVDDSGKVLESKTINKNLHLGTNVNLENISVPLNVQKANRYTVKLSLEGTPYENNWHIWVYPKASQIEDSKVSFTRSFDQALSWLKAGKTVLLNPKVGELKGVTGRFVPVFWSPVHFPDQPGTMGLLIDENNEALAEFPTSSHTEWQWWGLTKKSKAVELPNIKLKTPVRVIDNFVTNRHLANVFEAKVSNGKLLFCSMDIANDLNNRPSARQLRYSLSKYMNNGNFNPEIEITPQSLLQLKSKG